MIVNRKKFKVKMTKVAFGIWFLIGLCRFEVSAYSARHRDSNYLSHDTHHHQEQQQPQQQYPQDHHQQTPIQDALNAGTGSSQVEMNFRPLGDYIGGATASRESSGETSLSEPPRTQYFPLELDEDTAWIQELEDQQQQQPPSPHHHHSHHHQKAQQHQLRVLHGSPHAEGVEMQRNLQPLKDITQVPLLSFYTMSPLAAKTNNNDFSAESGMSANNGNYADIDNIYKQDMPGGNYNVHKWGGDNFKDDNEVGVWSWLNDDDIEKLNDGQKRNAFHAIKRKKSRKRQAQFMPGISVGAMTNLGDFFDNLKNNIDFLEKGELSDEQLQLLDGQHPLNSLKKEISLASGESDSWHNNGPHGTAAFIHAIRTYRPSARIRNLISSVPEGYRGTNMYDPNYKWIGLGKRSYY